MSLGSVDMVSPAVEVPTGPWPREVELIISALRAAEAPYLGKRDVARTGYRVRATLKLFSDLPGQGPWLLYTRDVNVKGLGFLTPHRLPLGYGGRIDLPAPGGRPVSVHCTLLRCRQVTTGWFDGALYFNRQQPMFDLNAQ